MSRAATEVDWTKLWRKLGRPREPQNPERMLNAARALFEDVSDDAVDRAADRGVLERTNDGVRFVDVPDEEDATDEDAEKDGVEADSDGSHPRCSASEDDENDNIAEHYARLTPVLEALGESDGAHTLGVHDHHGWYNKSPENDTALIDEGYDRRGRPFDLVQDADEFLSRIDRHYYSVLNYQSPEVLRDAEPCRSTEDGTEWRDKSPLPNYEDVEALTLFVDVDLKDEYKERPLPPEKRATFEDVIRGFVDAFGALVGQDNVYVLDSVGGAYVFGAPRVTAPIGDAFDGEERGWIFEEFAKRVREWIGERADEVIQEAEADGLCKADLLVNVNRQYKAPLSLHKSIDGVVHPLDTEDVSYDFVPHDAVGDTLIDETVEWCDEFTAPAQSDEHTENLVSTLFEDYDGAAWRDRLEAFASKRREEEREREERKKRAVERRDEREAGGVDFENAEVTPHVQDVMDAVDDIDVADVIRRYASDAWDTSNRTHETTFSLRGGSQSPVSLAPLTLPETGS
ncbi:hypothetical protein EGH25_11075 [Haladaptatus sp. F3-133]|uniref:Uncharacterized protein n=1 Tax=Halorutilus salinus TaxID=2487751 RepID=A0A9Q4GHH5_9EURY|nr:hypothetical protein [Halorutilus salinus]MCX2819892.1 hypothetical protein [Halorutilus salinus]